MTELTSVKEILTQLKPELAEKYFVNSIGLFGSIVRDEFTNKSDVDIIVDFSRPVGIEFIEPILLVEDIIDSANKILEYTYNLSFEEFTRDSPAIPIFCNAISHS